MQWYHTIATRFGYGNVGILTAVVVLAVICTPIQYFVDYKLPELIKKRKKARK